MAPPYPSLPFSVVCSWTHTICLSSTSHGLGVGDLLPKHFEISKLQSPIQEYQNLEKAVKAVFSTHKRYSGVPHSTYVQTLCVFYNHFHSGRVSTVTLCRITVIYVLAPELTYKLNVSHWQSPDHHPEQVICLVIYSL